MSDEIKDTELISVSKQWYLVKVSERRRCEAKIDMLHEQRRTLKGYCYVKLEIEDWHAVADAAMDLREIDRELLVLKALVDES